jgi:hypothetical protein
MTLLRNGGGADSQKGHSNQKENSLNIPGCSCTKEVRGREVKAYEEKGLQA